MSNKLATITGGYDPWWVHDDIGSDAASWGGVISELHRIEALEVFRRESDRLFARYYGDPRYCGWSTVGIQYPTPNIMDESRSSENVIREIISTLNNKFASNKPVPTVITSGGSYKEKNEAAERETWVRACFEEDKLYDKLSIAQFHSMAICDGFIGIRDDLEIGRPVAYQIPPWEIHVDPVDAQYGTPRSLFRVAAESKEVFAARYPEYADECWRATTFFEELWNLRLYNNDSRQLNYVEAWHLPSAPDADDGRHIIAINNCTLVNEEWKYNYFPVVKVPWNPRVFGYFSVGLIEDLIGPQRQLSKVRNAIDEHMRLLSGSFWAVQRGSQIVKSHISNLIGRVIEYTTTAPQLMTPEPVSAALTTHQQDLRNQIFAQSGVSQMSSQAMKPAGLNSGKALRVYADQEDQRFLQAYQAKEAAVVDLANLYMKRAQAMLEEAGDEEPALKAKMVKDGQLIEAEWIDTDIEDIRIRVLPASSLSTTLAGRIEDIMDLQSLGLITDEDQKRQLIQMPDLKADSDLSLAPRNLILRTLQTDILEKGMSIIPEPYWPLQTCATLGLQVLCFAQLKGYPDDRIQLLQNWVNECVARLNPPPPAPTPAAMQGAAQVGPNGMPLPGANPQFTPPGMLPNGAPLPAGPNAGSPVNPTGSN